MTEMTDADLDVRSETALRLCHAAERGDWVYVDDNIKGVTQLDCQWFENVGLSDASDNIRDLSATALEGKNIAYNTKLRLERMLLNDPSEAVRFRAAIVLNHPKHNDRSPVVLDIINNALTGTDDAMRKKAQEALERLNGPAA